ncbi:putative serine/threonine protein kinase [Trypanosoma grayi]|uniref:putative serine/threonine protein kinase n=1 Tax=Trypanosoma grayi TaxID=71804 RepID=UPI0004F46A65|nr:putative serine/threonine protein kinase [Trypanosoma grayi]KEG07675.1 putative serine/threonine protein kinase [Trypanosoma grayi]
MGMEHYQIIKQLGGTTGTFLAVDKQDGTRRVVIKRLVDGTQGMEELNVSLRVRHPNIIPFLESFVHDGGLYVVLAYAEGGDLEAHLECLAREKRPLPHSLMLRWFKQLIEALQCCHEQKIMHRDVKPGNVFLNAGATELYLGDFGSAKALLRTVSLTSTFVGTPIWISPELLTGTPYSFPSDVWSLGCVFYEIAALRRPFCPSSFANLVQQITSGDFAPLPPSVPEDVRAIITSMLQVDPKKRCGLTKVLEMTEQAITARSSPSAARVAGDKGPPPHLPKRALDAALVKVQQQSPQQPQRPPSAAEASPEEEKAKEAGAEKDAQQFSEWARARNHDLGVIERYLRKFRQSDERVLAATASTLEELQRRQERRQSGASPQRVATPPPVTQQIDSRLKPGIVCEVRMEAVPILHPPQQQQPLLQQQAAKPIVNQRRCIISTKIAHGKNDQDSGPPNRNASPLARLPSSGQHLNGQNPLAFRRLKSTPSAFRQGSPLGPGPGQEEERQLLREKREQERAKMIEMIREQKAKAIQQRKANGKKEPKDAVAVEIVLPDNLRYVDGAP